MTGSSEHLNESDAVLWTIERDPELRTTIVAVAVLDGEPDPTRLRERVEAVAQQVPRMRRRVASPPIRITTPTWVDDPQFRLDRHLRRVRAAEPGDLRSLLDLAGHAAMDPFDRSRPLWQFTVVGGLLGGRAAFVQKVHHSFTDGVGGMEMARLFLDLERDGSGPGALDTGTTEDEPASGRRARPHPAARAAKASIGFLGAAMRDPVGTASGTVATGVGTARSVVKLLRPARRPLSPVMRARGTARVLDAFDVPRARFGDAAHAVGGTLNDAFLASIAGGVRRYHEHHGVDPGAVRVTMPVNLRRADDDPISNRFSPVRFSMSAATADPQDRMRELGELARRWRREPALPLTDVLASGLNRLPAEVTTAYFGALLKSVDVVATNVPGLDHRRYLAGAELLREYAFAPVSGAAFSVALVSHVDHCCIGVNVDRDAIEDPDVLFAALRDGFAEVLATVDGVGEVADAFGPDAGGRTP